MIQTNMHPTRETREKELKGWHVMLIMLGFFGVMFSVNGVFLYHAVTSFPGEDVKKSYVQGLNYNETLATRALQSELGWRAEAGFDGEQIVLRLRDSEGQPVTNQIIIGELRRPATRNQDHTLAFKPGPNGEYFATPTNVSAGQWLLRANILDARSEALRFEVEKTLLLP